MTDDLRSPEDGWQDDAEFAPELPAGDLALLARARRSKRHVHWWKVEMTTASADYGKGVGSVTVTQYEVCDLCGLTRSEYEARQRRGRNNRKRGQAIQRQRIVGLGGRNLAGNNPNLDGIHPLFAFESKSGASFPERAWRWLRGIPHDADQVPVLIITEASGIGRKARSVVIVDFEDWKDLHGTG